MPRPRTGGDYQDGITAASRAGLAEVMTALGAYRDALVLIGGWAPYLILDHGEQPQRDFVHVGSIDIDFVVDPERVNADQYATIVRLLKDHGYQSCGDSKHRQRPFQNKALSFRTVELDSNRELAYMFAQPTFGVACFRRSIRSLGRAGRCQLP